MRRNTKADKHQNKAERIPTLSVILSALNASVKNLEKDLKSSGPFVTNDPAVVQDMVLEKSKLLATSNVTIITGKCQISRNKKATQKMGAELDHFGLTEKRVK